MMIIVSIIALILCNIAVFWYAAKAFTIISVNKSFVALLILFNTFFMLFPCIFDSPHMRESVIALTYFIILVIEFKLIFRSDIFITLFGAFCFSICVTCIRAIVISVYAIAYTQPMNVFIETNDSLVTIVTNLIMAVYLLILNKLLPMKIVDAAISNKKNTIFAIMVLATLFVYLLINKDIIYLEANIAELARFYLKVAISGLLGFASVLVYSYIFSLVTLGKARYTLMEEQITLQKQEIIRLETCSYIDSTTRLVTREFAENIMRDYLRTEKRFTVVFLDIDRLKAANDEYGHNEGDFYIQKVADILASIFQADTVARFGGDEFLVLIDSQSEYYSGQKVLLCCQEVDLIKKTYHKPYETSISYGIVDVKFPTNITVEQIIKSADTKMYEYKRRNKKNRA